MKIGQAVEELLELGTTTVRSSDSPSTMQRLRGTSLRGPCAAVVDTRGSGCGGCPSEVRAQLLAALRLTGKGGSTDIGCGVRP